MSEIDETKEKEIRRRKEELARSGGGFLGKVVAFILGVVIGIGAIAGTVAVVVSTILNKPIKEITTMIDGKENGNIYQTLFGVQDKVGFLNADYANKKVLDLFTDVTSTVGALSSGGSLNDLDKISPMVGSTVSKLLETTDGYGIPIDKTALMAKPFGELGGYLGAQVKAAPLGTLLEAVGLKMDDLTMYLCYGEENVDYTVDAEGNVTMKDGKEAKTIQYLLDTGFNGLIDTMPLGTFLGDSEDEIMRTIAYGSDGHYTVGKDGKITMNQVRYAVKEGKLYDYSDGKEVDGAYDASVGTVTFTDGTVYYLDGELKAYTAAAKGETDKALYKKTTIADFTNNATGIIDDLAMDAVMPADKNTHSIMLSLMYGSGNYEFDADGNPVALAPAKTIGDLRTNSGDLINGIYLKDAISVDANSNATMLYLAYGEEGANKDYQIIDGEIVMNEGKTPRTIGDLSNDSSSLLDGLLLKDALSINEDSHPIMISLAYGKKDVHYQIGTDGIEILSQRIAILGNDTDGYKAYDAYGDLLPGTVDFANKKYSAPDGEGTIVYDFVPLNGDEKVKTVTTDDGEATFYYLKKDGDFLDYEPRKLSDMTGSNNKTLINNIALADALNIDPDDPNDKTHAVLKSLAFDDNGNARTLDDLSGEKGNELIENIKLADALGVKNDEDDESHAVIKALVFDDEGNSRTLKDLSGENGSKLIDDIKLSDALGIEKDDTTSHPILKSIIFDETTGESRTLKDLSGAEGKELINDVPLTSVFENPDTSSTVMMYMLYGGKEGIHYTVDGDGNVVAGQKRIAIKDTNTAYNPYKTSLIPATPALSPITLIGGKYYYAVGETTYLCKLVSEVNATDANPTLEVNGEAIPYYFLFLEGENGAEDTPVYYEARTIGDLASETDNPLSTFEKELTLEDILGKDAIAGNNVLEAISDSTIDNLAETMNNLTVSDVFGDSIKTDRTWWYLLHDGEKCYQDDYNNHKLYHDKLEDTHNDATCQFEEKHNAYHTDPTKPHNDSSMIGACPFTHQNICGDYCENVHDYTINEMEKLVTNMSNNMKKVTLRTLVNDNMITLSEGTLSTALLSDIVIDLNNDGTPELTVPIQRPAGTENKVELGELTISETIAYIGYVLTAISSLNTVVTP